MYIDTRLTWKEGFLAGYVPCLPRPDPIGIWHGREPDGFSDAVALSYGSTTDRARGLIQ